MHNSRGIGLGIVGDQRSEAFVFRSDAAPGYGPLLGRGDPFAVPEQDSLLALGLSMPLGHLFCRGPSWLSLQ